ncbi:MAG: pyridoxal phosphate-dependent aminotransferase [Oscillospiraceae bacterium]|jgi:aspartate aminotransferase|nr:pyridoxal phosphate-dependent aminotransferase [Oscillospiraceae bacterium]
MKEISKIASEIQASTTVMVDSLYKKMKADGEDVVGFGAGEPDFDTPDNIKDAAHTAIRNGQTKYTHSSGMPELRAAVADRLMTDLGINYTPEQIIIASGAKHSVYIALKTLINHGDEVILPAPFWVTYAESIKIAGGVPIIVSASESNDFKITKNQLEAVVSDRTKLFIINNPSNPTGMLYSENELRDLIDVCVRHDLYIISDEIYYNLVYDGKKFTSIAQLSEDVKERTIIINGVSKTYAMTGWRIGYSASNKTLAGVMGNYLSHSTSSPSTISQLAAVEAMKGSQKSVITMRDEFERRRDYIVERVNAIDGVSCRKPDGAFYIMLNIEKLIGKKLGGKLIHNSDDFSLAFLESGKVAAVSCSGFGCDNFVRLTYATSMETIKEGMDRLERFVAY